MKLFYLIVLLFLLGFNVNAQLTLRFSNLTPQKSVLRIGLYTENESFASDSFFLGYLLPCDKEDCYLTIDDLEPGEYAISLYQDLNNNEKMDKKAFGIPKEPYGFSGNPRIGLRIPSFKDCSFSYEGKDSEIMIIMNQP